MWDTIAIIVTLGGLEFLLWFLHRKDEAEDRLVRKQQLEALHDIVTELVIAGQDETEDACGIDAVPAAEKSLGNAPSKK